MKLPPSPIDLRGTLDCCPAADRRSSQLPTWVSRGEWRWEGLLRWLCRPIATVSRYASIIRQYANTVPRRIDGECLRRGNSGVWKTSESGYPRSRRPERVPPLLCSAAVPVASTASARPRPPDCANPVRVRLEPHPVDNCQLSVALTMTTEDTIGVGFGGVFVERRRQSVAGAPARNWAEPVNRCWGPYCAFDLIPRPAHVSLPCWVAYGRTPQDVRPCDRFGHHRVVVEVLPNNAAVGPAVGNPAAPTFSDLTFECRELSAHSV